MQRRVDNGTEDSEFFDKLVYDRIRNKQAVQAETNAYQKSIAKNLVSSEPISNQTKIIIEKNKKAPHVVAREDVKVSTDPQAVAARIQSSLMQNKGGNCLFAEEQVYKTPPQLRGQVGVIYERIQKGQAPFPQYNLLNETLRGVPTTMNRQGPGNQSLQQNQQGNSPQACRVQKGYPVFQGLKGVNGFGSNVPLVRATMVADDSVASMQFIFNGVVDAFIVQPNQNVVNMQEIERNPQLKTRLVELKGPYGNILVPQEAVMREPQPGMPVFGNRHLIKDDYSQHRLQQQQRNQGPVIQTARPQKKGMLLG